MPLKIVRNDITKMNTDIIVNTANEQPVIGTGCDYAIYQAAGCDELLAYRKEHIGYMPEGEVFITPAFRLPVKHIIHAVSPYYEDGLRKEEEKLRACYRKSLQLAHEVHARSIAFPLISTGGFGYPKDEGLRIAVDEINAFLLSHNMDIYLVVFDQKIAKLGTRLYPDLESYIDQKYVEVKRQEEYFESFDACQLAPSMKREKTSIFPNFKPRRRKKFERDDKDMMPSLSSPELSMKSCTVDAVSESSEDATDDYLDFESLHESKLQERMRHMSDTFSQYLLYLIQSKNMENAEVYKRAIVDKKIFSKIKNNVNYHPQKMTALCLCIGAKLNLDESKDLLARAGYALSPCDKTDIIFSYFIENKIYDMIELDIQLEEHGLPCIIS